MPVFKSVRSFFYSFGRQPVSSDNSFPFSSFSAVTDTKPRIQIKAIKNLCALQMAGAFLQTSPLVNPHQGGRYGRGEWLFGLENILFGNPDLPI